MSVTDMACDEKKSTGCCGKNPRLDGLVVDFLSESSLHGVKYLGEPDRHWIEKIFWGAALLTCLGVSIYLVEEVFSKYNDSPVIISFQPKETSVGQIPFPAITLCNVNILKRDAMKEVYEDVVNKVRKENNRITNGTLKAALTMEHISHYCLSAQSFRRRLGLPLFDIQGEKDFVQQVDTILGNLSETNQKLVDDEERRPMTPNPNNTHSFFHKASHKCEDMILKCMWAGDLVDCRKLFWSLNTRNGHCCVFNMMPSYLLRKMDLNDSRVLTEISTLPEEAKKEWKSLNTDKIIRENDELHPSNYPKYQTAGGKPYGLTVLINPEMNMYSTCKSNDGFGFKMVAHSPLSFPGIMEFGHAIAPNSEVFAEIQPQLTIADKDLFSIPVEKRGCLFPQDNDAQLNTYHTYSATNCLDECIAQYTYENCSCVRYFMPRNATQSLCNAKKRKCAEYVLRNVTTSGKLGKCPNCLPACTDVKYKMQLSHFPLQENSTSHFPYYNAEENATKDATNYSILHIYLGTDSFYAKERKKLYGAADLLANAGGLLSLTLGFSIISLVEIIYFCTFRAWYSFRPKGKDNKVSEIEENDFYSGGGQYANAPEKFNLEKTTIANYNSWASKKNCGNLATSRHIALIRVSSNFSNSHSQ